jgi:CheY-like chemotaxis protein
MTRTNSLPIAIPRQAGAAQRPAGQAGHVQTTQPRPGNGHGYILPGRTVRPGPPEVTTALVVDDDAFVAQVIGLAFEDSGYHVMYATSGSQALAQLAVGRPDVIITDQMMPGMDGPALVRHIRADPSFDSIPIVLMSAIPPRPSLSVACPGAQVFLQKPFRLEQALTAIEGVLRRL